MEEKNNTYSIWNIRGNKNKYNIWNTIGMTIGLLAIIIGIVVMVRFPGSYGGYYKGLTFGADFYTESHKATAAAVSRLGYIYELMRFALGWFFIFFGAIDICAFGSKLCASVENEDYTESVDTAPTASEIEVNDNEEFGEKKDL